MIEDAVKKFKRENGNNTFTTKDMVIYLITKLDSLDKRIGKHIEEDNTRFGKLQGSFDFLVKFLIITIPIILATIGYMYKMHILP